LAKTNFTSIFPCGDWFNPFHCSQGMWVLQTWVQLLQYIQEPHVSAHTILFLWVKCWRLETNVLFVGSCYTLWRASKSFVRPQEGPTMSSCGRRRNLVPLPASSIEGGWEGRAESSRIRLRRGTIHLATRSCIKNQPPMG
jgi:hypothetical protein